MEEWINNLLASEQAGISILAAVFLMGIISVFTCACNYAIIGTLAGYTGTVGASGKTKTVVISSIFFLLGTVISMTAVGCIIGYAGEMVSNSLGNYWKIGAGIISIFFGLYTINLLPFKIPALSLKPTRGNGSIGGAMVFGLLIGGGNALCGLCCSPLFPVVMAASFVNGSMTWGILMLFLYSLGYGFVLSAAMLGVGLGLGKISKSITNFATVLKYLAGVSLILLGFYFLLTI
jgi:cytochrome c-type biogenesis protein